MPDNSNVSFVESRKIQVFPYSQNRDDYQENSRVLNEKNLTNLIKKLAGKDSCVLSRTSVDGATGIYNWEIILHGYLFQFTYTTPTEDDKSLYASIVIDNNQLSGDDTASETSQFTGLTISSSEPSDVSAFLQLLDANGNVPESSWFRFNSHSISMEDSSSLERRLSWQAAPLKNNS